MRANSKFKFFLFVFLVFSGIIQKYAQQVDADLGEINFPNPPSYVDNYEYDPESDLYYFNTKVGEYDISYPIILTPEEYQELILKEDLKDYYKAKIDAEEGKKEGSEDGQKNLIPEIYVNSKLFQSIFGGNTIEVVPQGSLEVDLGVLYTKQDNPSFSPRNRSNLTFDFDQRIGLSLVGKVGTRVQVNANFDTQSSFDFQNLLKLEYEPTEDDIIQGAYRIKSFQGDKKPQIRLLGSGPILQYVLEASQTLHEKYNIDSEVWSVTSYGELRRFGQIHERNIRLKINEELPHVSRCFGDKTPTVAVSDYIAAVPEMIQRWVGGRFTVLGTDGFGRSDTRDNLRKFFEIDTNSIVGAAISTLEQEKEIPEGTFDKASIDLNLNSKKSDKTE